MKIAVYSIALNEEKHVERWARSARDADYILMADTGSTDGTLDLLHNAFNEEEGWPRDYRGVKGAGPWIKFHSSKIHISPWRFDHARNAALALLPPDIDLCITLDLDEILTPGWREHIEAVWTPEATRLRYGYVWNWHPDGSPNIQFQADRAHARNGYQWKGPVHEVITPATTTREHIVTTDAVLIHHHADDAKPRSSYLPLLELAVAENPNDDRACHYLGREYMFHGRYEEAIRELKRHLTMPSATWPDERAASMRFLGKMTGDEGWYLAAVGEAPHNRDAWYDLAQYRLNHRDWIGAVHACQKAIAITGRPSHYLATSEAWTYGPYDVGSVAAHYAGMTTLAREWYARAVEMRPVDERIKRNGVFING